MKERFPKNRSWFTFFESSAVLTPCSLAGFVQWQGCVGKLVPCPWVCPREAAIQQGLSLGEKECFIKKKSLKERKSKSECLQLVLNHCWQTQDKGWWLFVLPWGLGQVLSPRASFSYTKHAHGMDSSVYITCRSACLAWGKKRPTTKRRNHLNVSQL